MALRGTGRAGVALPLTILNLIILGPLCTLQNGNTLICIDRIDPQGLAQWIKDEQDGSLSFLCAIDEGIVVRIGEAVDPVTTVSRAFEDVRSIVPKPEVVLGCDCILRRIELEERGVAGEVARIYADNHVVGFNTYGEQFNAAHVNQTFTGVAIGG